jgi:hypothetical protein
MHEAMNKRHTRDNTTSGTGLKLPRLRTNVSAGGSSIVLRSYPETQFVIKEGRFPDYTCIPMSFRYLDIVIIIGYDAGHFASKSEKLTARTCSPALGFHCLLLNMG